jgi:hypothetical protein
MSNKTEKKQRRMYRSEIDNIAHSTFGKATTDIVKKISRQRDVIFIISIVLLVLLVITNLLR